MQNCFTGFSFSLSELSNTEKIDFPLSGLLQPGQYLTPSLNSKPHSGQEETQTGGQEETQTGGQEETETEGQEETQTGGQEETETGGQEAITGDIGGGTQVDRPIVGDGAGDIVRDVVVGQESIFENFFTSQGGSLDSLGIVSGETSIGPFINPFPIFFSDAQENNFINLGTVTGGPVIGPLINPTASFGELLLGIVTQGTFGNLGTFRPLIGEANIGPFPNPISFAFLQIQQPLGNLLDPSLILDEAGNENGEDGERLRDIERPILETSVIVEPCIRQELFGVPLFANCPKDFKVPDRIIGNPPGPILDGCPGSQCTIIPCPNCAVIECPQCDKPVLERCPGPLCVVLPCQPQESQITTWNAIPCPECRNPGLVIQPPNPILDPCPGCKLILPGGETIPCPDCRRIGGEIILPPKS